MRAYREFMERDHATLVGLYAAGEPVTGVLLGRAADATASWRRGRLWLSERLRNASPEVYLGKNIEWERKNPFPIPWGQ